MRISLSSWGNSDEFIGDRRTSAARLGHMDLVPRMALPSRNNCLERRISARPDAIARLSATFCSGQTGKGILE